MQKGPTFREVIEKFLAHTEERGVEPATSKSYAYLARRFLVPALGELDVTLLKPHHFDALGQAMKASGLSTSTIKKANTLAGQVLKYAERQEWVDRNVARLAELPKSEPVVRDVPDPEKVAGFLEFCLTEDALIFDYTWVLANTGMRPSEACAIRTDDLDADDILTIQRAVDVSHCTNRLKGTKTNRVRRIALDADTARIIRSRGPFVFGGDEPARTDLMSKRFKRRGRKSGIVFKARNLRHFHATQLIAAGHSPKDVSQRLGHTTDTITQLVYAQVVEARDLALRNSVASLFVREDAA